MKCTFTTRAAVVVLNLTVFAAQLAGAGCNSDSSKEPPITCEESSRCEISFEQLAAGCMVVDDELAIGASRWRSKAQDSADEPFEPSYVFLVREEVRHWDDHEEPSQWTETKTYRIVVERGVAIETRELSGLKGGTEEITVEALFEELAARRCEEPYTDYRTEFELHSTLGYPTLSQVTHDLSETGYEQSWNIDCLALDTSDPAACPLPTE